MSDNKQIIGKISHPISIEDAIVKSSIQIFTLESGSLMPSGFGSGFIIVYKERFEKLNASIPLGGSELAVMEEQTSRSLFLRLWIS
jgi:hypothetical protein